MAKLDARFKIHRHTQVNYTGGVFSPELVARTDLDKHNEALAAGQNFLALPHGPLTKRPGTRYIAEVKTSADNTRLIPFIHSNTDTYILEFGDQYVRVFKDEGVVLDPTTPNPPYEVSGTVPYLESEVQDIRYVQSPNVLYLFHGNHEPRQLTRTSDTAWTIAVYEMGDGPYRPANTTSTTLSFSATTGSVTITASADVFTTVTDVGRKVRVKHGTTWGYLELTAVSNPTSAVGTVVNALGGTSGTADWRLGAFSDTTGWPSAQPTFYNNRMVVGRTTSDPNWFWMSEAEDFESFAPSDTDSTVTDAHAIARGIQDRKVNEIYWLTEDSEVLIAGTSDGVFKIWSGTSTDIISPTKITENNQTRSGSADLIPALTEDTILFVGRSTLTVRELSFSLEKDKRVAPDRTILSEHITDPGIAEIVYQEEQDHMIWARLTDGKLISLTYIPDQKVVTWLEQPIGGTDVQVKSLAVVPSVDGKSDTVYMIVERTINGATVQYVEFLEEKYAPTSASSFEDAFFVDSGLTYNSTSTSTITGLDHLEGETVKVLADGATHPDVVVSSGSITLERSASQVQIGLSYLSMIETLEPKIESALGPSTGRVSQISKVVLRLKNSLGGRVGADSSDMEDLEYRDVADEMDAPPDLFTGYDTVILDDKVEEESTFRLEHDSPLPFSLLSHTKYLRVEAD